MTHPLGYFMDFIDNNQLNTLRESFYNYYRYDKRSPIINLIEESVEYDDIFNEIGQPDSEKFYFIEDYLAIQFNDKRLSAIQLLDLLLVEEPDVKRMQVRITTMLSTILVYIEKVKANKEFKRYPVILDCYNQLQDYLHLKAQAVGMMTSKGTKPPIKKDTGFKLQWTDTAQAIATLFYKLCYEYNNNGKSFVIAKQKSDIIDLIVDNFVSENGQQFEPGTISDSMKANKVESRPLLTDGIKNIIEEISPQPKKGTR